MVMVNEIPAPTFKEHNRARFLVDRFSELEMLNASVDEMGNVLGIIPGKRGDRDILVAAHLDSLFDETVDHTVTLEPTLAIGPGVSDNSLGVAILGTLPLIMERIGLELDANLVLLGSARSLGGETWKASDSSLTTIRNPSPLLSASKASSSGG